MVHGARIKRSPLTTLETTKGGTVVETALLRDYYCVQYTTRWN